MLISWNVTKECNLSCRHCYRDAGEKARDELTTQEGKDLLEEMEVAGFKIIVFSGGEPLLREDVFELISFAQEIGLRPVLGTNGTLITRETTHKLKQAGCQRVGISLDSLTPKTHDRFRNENGAWARSVNAMKLCREIGLPFQVHTTITKNNYEEIEEICDFVENLGACANHLFFLVPCGRAKDDKDIYLTAAEHERVLYKILEKQKSTTMELKPVCAPQFIRLAAMMKQEIRFDKGCLAGISYCCILPNGDLHPCPYLPLKVGNVREERFSELWQTNDVFWNLRRRDYRGRCAGCEHKTTCGGCRAVAYYYQGDYLGEDILCGYAK
ncbi:MAG: radical SAM protein [Candidatus Omnitrophota bacterium]